MYPRNQGVVRDEAWEPATSFRSHVRSFTESVGPTLNTITRDVNLIDL